jgi:hypothetical protein
VIGLEVALIATFAKVVALKSRRSRAFSKAFDLLILFS